MKTFTALSSFKEALHPIIKYFIVGISIVFSFGPIVSPYLNGIGEVCCPNIWRNYLFGGAFLFTGLGIVTLSIYTLLFIIALIRGRYKNRKRLIILSTFLLAGFWGSSYIVSSTYFNRLSSAYPIGAYIRLFGGGGSEKIRNDAIQLFETSSEVNFDHESLPQSFKKLGATRVKLYKEVGTIRIDITSGSLYGSMRNFGFVIEKNQDSNLLYFGEIQPNTTRLWKIDEGFYFFQTEF